VASRPLRFGAATLAVLAPAACGADATSARKADVAPPDLVVVLDGGVTIDFVLVKPGTFTMGGDREFESDKLPLHQVKIAKPFYLGRYEVTQQQWQAVMGTRRARDAGPDNPADFLHWDDCRQFVAKLNATQSAPTYFIPSEAQWEYACRAGSTTKWCFGDDEARLGEFAWYRANSGGREDPADKNILYDASTHPVGQKKPNAWGLYDMHGNVGEWCADAWHRDYAGAPTNGSAWELPDADGHVVRGGGYSSDAAATRSASRGYGQAPSATFNVVAGFRLARFVDAARADDSAPAARATDAPLDVEAAAMKILDTYRGEKSANYPDPREKNLVALGRPALGVLLKVMSDPAFDDQWAMRTAVKRALPTLVLDEDAPSLARLMREGHRGVEVAFAALNAPESIATYAALLREGCFDTGLHEAARPHLRDPAVVAAVCAWLADPKYDGDLNFAIAKMAELVGGTGPYRLPDDPKSARRPDSRQPLPDIMPEAGPALRALLAKRLRIDAWRNVAAALVRIGDKEGVFALIEVLAKPAGKDDPPPVAYQREAAGELLNAVSGTRIYAGRDDVGEAMRFAEWWRDAKDRLRFDPATQSWSVK